MNEYFKTIQKPILRRKNNVKFSTNNYSSKLKNDQIDPPSEICNI